MHMHVGGLLVFDGTLSREAVVKRLRERIHLIPRYAMRLDPATLGLASPVWVEDEAFDPERHVRRMALPGPGGDAELCELVGDLMSGASIARGRCGSLWSCVEGAVADLLDATSRLTGARNQSAHPYGRGCMRFRSKRAP